MKDHAVRRALAVIGLASVAALAFLFWLIYFNQGGRTEVWGVKALPAVNALLNSASALCLVAGLVFIRSGNQDAHRKAMLGALVFSSLFLISYIVYHYAHGDTRFTGQGLVRPIYFFILISHVLLSIAALPLVLTTFFLALSGRFPIHRKVARVTLPLWLYVSVTGVVVFFMLRLYG